MGCRDFLHLILYDGRGVHTHNGYAADYPVIWSIYRPVHSVFWMCAFAMVKQPLYGCKVTMYGSDQ
jgi:hypothetical protein